MLSVLRIQRHNQWCNIGKGDDSWFCFDDVRERRWVSSDKNTPHYPQGQLTPSNRCLLSFGTFVNCAWWRSSRNGCCSIWLGSLKETPCHHRIDSLYGEGVHENRKFVFWREFQTVNCGMCFAARSADSNEELRPTVSTWRLSLFIGHPGLVASLRC
jgi:hypothetical protein